MSHSSEFEGISSPAMAKELATRLRPFTYASVATALGGDPDDATFAIVTGELSQLVSAHVTSLPCANSFSLKIGPCGTQGREAQPSLGIGLFKFDFTPDGSPTCGCVGDEPAKVPAVAEELFVLHQELGEPVGTDCGPSILSEFVLISKGIGKLSLLRSFCSFLIADADKVEPRTFSISRWHVQNQYWRHEQRVSARSIDSVVLPKETSEELVADISEFCSAATAGWYAKHGIPYKRSYLFYGVPGAGKTSLLQAIAGKYGRNLCYLSPTHPEMTDDSLKNAIVRAPPNSIIVLEDVDALFGPKRENKVATSPLTFSGLLNALDGCGQGRGAIFILTSNHREQLDKALIRAGRVDKHVCFGYATAEQMSGLFLQFYPSASAELAAAFAANAQAALGERQVAMAGLQHYFIGQRGAPAEVAASAEAVEAIAKDLDEREEEAAAKAAAAKAAKAGEEQKEKPAGVHATPEAGAGSVASLLQKAVNAAATGSKSLHLHVGGTYNLA